MPTNPILIKTVNLHHLKMTLKNPFVTSYGTTRYKEFFLIEVIAKDGTIGFGESVAFTEPWYTEETFMTTKHILTNFLIPMILKNHISHPDDVSKLFASIRRNNMAKAALEGAIWDIYAKQRELTLAKALGGDKTAIDVGISIGIKESENALLQTIGEAMLHGYKRIKLKIKPGKDVSILQTVRQHFPDTPIMVDANSAYTLADVSLLQELDAFNLLMIEQPLAQDDILDHAKLQKQIKTPICLDESICSLKDAQDAIALRSCGVINIKIGRVGGLTEARRIHDLCRKNDLPVWCGGMLEAGVGRAHNIALTALPGFSLPGDTAGSANYWHADIIDPEVIVENGQITVPGSPGIGYNVNWDVVKKHRIGLGTYQL